MDLSYGTKRRLQYQDPSTDFRLSHQQPAARGECFQHSGASGRAGRKPQPHHGVPLSGQAGRGAAHHEIRCRQGRKSRVPVRGRDLLRDSTFYFCAEKGTHVRHSVPYSDYYWLFSIHDNCSYKYVDEFYRRGTKQSLKDLDGSYNEWDAN